MHDKIPSDKIQGVAFVTLQKREHFICFFSVVLLGLSRVGLEERPISSRLMLLCSNGLVFVIVAGLIKHLWL